MKYSIPFCNIWFGVTVLWNPFIFYVSVRTELWCILWPGRCRNYWASKAEWTKRRTRSVFSTMDIPGRLNFTSSSIRPKCSTIHIYYHNLILQIGLRGEDLHLYDPSEASPEWVSSNAYPINQPLIWYKVSMIIWPWNPYMTFKWTQSGLKDKIYTLYSFG